MLDFVKFISENTPKLNNAKRKALLEDLAESFQYKTEVEDPSTGAIIPNPQNRTDFVNEKLTNYIKLRVKGARAERAQKAISIEELEI